jgi:hypothetical protein
LAAVLLRLAWLNALDADAKAKPPDGEFGEAEESIRAGKRDAIIRADGGWQAALATQMLEDSDSRILAHGIEGFPEKQMA